MKIQPELNGTTIGGICTLISCLLTFTFVIPILTILPGAQIKGIMMSLVDNEPYSNVGKATLLTLSIIFLISLVFIVYQSRKTVFTDGHIILIMMLEYFIIHNLGLYFYWGTKLSFRSDGQLAFAAINSFPISSLGFLLLGILIDVVKLKPKPALEDE